MAKSVPAIMILAGIGFAGSGFAMWRYSSWANTGYQELMKLTGKPTTETIMESSNGDPLVIFGVFLVVLGFLAYIFGGRR